MVSYLQGLDFNHSGTVDCEFALVPSFGLNRVFLPEDGSRVSFRNVVIFILEFNDG
jgi:hypothetical protein